jgi:ubiquinone/menaquinone biosynthesis C-methylase UbiE
MTSASTASKSNPRHRWFAATYDFFSKMDEKKTSPMRDFAAGEASGKVLEMGAGTGLNFDHFDWSKVETLDATEPDLHMLKRAQTKLEALPAEVQSKVKLHEAPAEALPFPDGSMDVVVATLVFCTVADPDKAFAEAWRVLRPGGQLRLIEHVVGQGFSGGLQRVVQPVYGWVSAGCKLRRDTEADARRAGFDLEVTQRFSLGAIWPGFVGVATKPV